ncbi:resolvase [Chlamydia suis]|uniref:resolvase n=1 Tax=Chlamydia suis TaxID=83559 RepID=UPI002B38A1BC|nr:resolvase [Chlamydia suis]MEB2694253.1 resolvase [Chlamydia suis]
MSGLISYSELQQSAPLPVAIDYPAALALRQMALTQGKLPKYLLAPEVSALHHYVPDLHRRMLLATLWNTYICINEALALTLSDFSRCRPIPLCSLPRSKGFEVQPYEKTYGKRKIIV